MILSKFIYVLVYTLVMHFSLFLAMAIHLNSSEYSRLERLDYFQFN